MEQERKAADDELQKKLERWPSLRKFDELGEDAPEVSGRSYCHQRPCLLRSLMMAEKRGSWNSSKLALRSISSALVH